MFSLNDNLYNKARHSYIYVAYSRPNGWPEWNDIFCGHSCVAGGSLRLKKIRNFFLLFFFLILEFFLFFFHGQCQALQLVFINALVLEIINFEIFIVLSNTRRTLKDERMHVNYFLNWISSESIRVSVWHQQQFCDEIK